MVGNLPDDFLRVSPSSNETTSQTSNSCTLASQSVQHRNPNNAASQITLTIVQVRICYFLFFIEFFIDIF